MTPKWERLEIIKAAYEKYNFNIEPTPPKKRADLMAKFLDTSVLPYGGAGSRQEWQLRFVYFINTLEQLARTKRPD